MVDPSPSAGATGASPERHITLENALNFRDVGGYPTADGRSVRWRRMFRAGGLSELSEADLVVLDELGIKTVLDLRSTAELESGKFPVDDMPVTHHHLPLVEQVLDPTKYSVPEGMLAARYQEISQIGATFIAQSISIIAARPKVVEAPQQNAVAPMNRRPSPSLCGRCTASGLHAIATPQPSATAAQG